MALYGNPRYVIRECRLYGANFMRKTSTTIEPNRPATSAKKSTNLGRARDTSIDTKILAETIDILADAGFDGMTMDMVAVRAKVGKTTIYRRWTSKVELVRDALNWMNQKHVELNELPDTGSLRNDLIKVLRPQSLEEEERKLRVIASLGSFFFHPEFAKVRKSNSLADLNRKIFERAVIRGEISADTNIEMACQVINSMVFYMSIGEHKVFDDNTYMALLDGIILPALKYHSQK
jgi:AcrR family transcriptional regulator